MTRSIFSSDFIKDISDKYFGSKSLACNDIFFTHEKESNISILPWHFDRQQSLKFYINLVNVDKTNGAFEYDIGSHREGHFRANFYILSGVKVGEIPNNIPENELHNPTTIIADAGDLIIFDPDGRIGMELGVYATPETFLINQEGVILYKHIGEITPEVWSENFLVYLKTI